MLAILGYRGEERFLGPTGKVVGKRSICGHFPGAHSKRDGDELPKSTHACGCGGTARTGLDTKLSAMPGSLGDFLFGGTVFGFSPASSLRAAF